MKKVSKLGSPRSVERPHFRPIKVVAAELNVNANFLRTYCIVSGIHTKLSHGGMLLDDEDTMLLIQWLDVYCARIDAEAYEVDPFAASMFPRALRRYQSAP